MANDKELSALIAGLMQQLDYNNQHLTEISEKLSSGVVNHILFAGTVALDSFGQWSDSWGATAGSVHLFNFSADTAMVLVPNTTSLVPTTGPGVHRFAFGTGRPVNVNARSLTVFGKAGDLFGLQVFTTGYKP